MSSNEVPARYRRRKRQLDKQMTATATNASNNDNIDSNVHNSVLKNVHDNEPLILDSDMNQQQQQPQSQSQTQLQSNYQPQSQLQSIPPTLRQVERSYVQDSIDQATDHSTNSDTNVLGRNSNSNPFTSSSIPYHNNNNNNNNDAFDFELSDYLEQTPFTGSPADSSFDSYNSSIESPTSLSSPIQQLQQPWTTRSSKTFTIKLDLPNKSVTKNLNSSTMVLSLLEEIIEQYPYEVGADIDEIMLWERIQVTPDIQIRRPLRDNEYLASVYDSWDLSTDSTNISSAYSIQLLSSVFRLDPNSIASVTPRRDVLQMLTASKIEREIYYREFDGPANNTSWSTCKAMVLSNKHLVLTSSGSIIVDVNVERFELYECPDLAAPGKYKLVLRSQQAPKQCPDSSKSLIFIASESQSSYELLRNVFFTLRFQASQNLIQTRPANYIPTGLKNPAAPMNSNETIVSPISDGSSHVLKPKVEQAQQRQKMIQSVPHTTTSPDSTIPANSLLGRTYTQKKRQQQLDRHKSMNKPPLPSTGIISSIPSAEGPHLFKANTLLGRQAIRTNVQPVLSPLQAAYPYTNGTSTPAVHEHQKNDH